MVRGLVALTLVLAGCVEDATPPPSITLPECSPLEIRLRDGNCLRPGVDPLGCAEGFAHDGEYGCEPILPSEPCTAGLLAVPGDTACRPVMPCSDETWGGIPTDASTQHVDAFYLGGASDGSAARPWTTLGDALAMAADGAVIAVEAGTYSEQLRIEGKHVRIWGVCPERVEIAGPVAGYPTVSIVGDAASGTELHGLSIAGVAQGVASSGTTDVQLDRLWVHDTGSWGVYADGALGNTALRVSGSLIEQSREVGVLVIDGEALVEASAVRSVLPRASDQTGGRGIYAGLACSGPMVCDAGARSTLTVRSSVIEQNRELGLSLLGSDATIEATVVRNTQPRPADGLFGRGISVQYACYSEMECDASLRSTATVRGSVVLDNHDVGMIVLGSSAVIESTVVRGTKPRAADGMLGRGLNIQTCAPDDMCAVPSPSNVSVQSSLVEQNHEIGVVVIGSEALLERTVVRDTLPEAASQRWGRGVHVQGVSTAKGVAHVKHCLVAQNRDVGIFVWGDAEIHESAVRDVVARNDGHFGDGLVVFGDELRSEVTVVGTSFSDLARAGIANFGAFVALADNTVRCAGFEIEGEVSMQNGTHAFEFDDRGGNRCGCPVTDRECVAVSAGIDAPAPVASP